MKKYCVLCLRWFGSLREVDGYCEVHTGVAKTNFVPLKDLKREFENRITHLKMKKAKVNESLDFCKWALSEINEAKVEKKT